MPERPRIRITIEVDMSPDFDRKDWQRYLVHRLHPVIGGEMVFVTTEEVTRLDVIAGNRRKGE